jgi:hypothetical protein
VHYRILKRVSEVSRWAVLLTLSGHLWAAGSVAIANLPAAVRYTLGSPGAFDKILRVEKILRDEKTVYCASVLKAGKKEDVYLDEAGSIIQITQDVSRDSLTPAARATIDSSVGSGEIVTLKSISLRNGVIAAYDLTYRHDGAEVKLRVGPNGSLVPE